jgi:hypothetical protein
MHARISGLLASGANVAVIFRRGPSKQTRMLLWDLNNDRVVPGQWIKGQVFTRRCDVSPDGRYVVCAITNYSQKRSADGTAGWTAISRPPYFSALALWFTGGAWNGGGIWVTEREVHLNNFHYQWQESQPVQPPVIAKNLNWPPSEDSLLYETLLKKRGWHQEATVDVELLNPKWKQVKKWLSGSLKGGFLAATMASLEDSVPRYRTARSGIWKKPFKKGLLLRAEHHDRETWSVCTPDEEPIRSFLVPQFGDQFLDIDRRGRVIYGDNGCLWAWRDFPKREPKLIADLNDQTFEEVPPPAWALQW